MEDILRWRTKSVASRAITKEWPEMGTDGLELQEKKNIGMGKNESNNNKLAYFSWAP